MDTEPTVDRGLNCARCARPVPADEDYVYAGRPVCENCYMHQNTFPLGHTGARRSRISEEGRQLAVWWQE
jgi:recombinational DNA repair protein (RecF pathway)